MKRMHVIEPKRYQSTPHRRHWQPYLLALLILVVAAGAVNYFRPLPSATASLEITAPATVTPKLAWPSDAEASVGAAGYGVLGTSGSQTPIATASIAKVITALCVLQKKPLQIGQSGPTYTVDTTDMSIYQNYVAEDGSLLPVQLGENLTEYQALEALMIPSANNIADSLVRWVFGSQAAYTTYADAFLTQHNINNTNIGSDASGFDPSTTSVPTDLTELGLLASQNPVLMQIASQSSVSLPIIGTATNYDTVLGQAGITGLKTGNNNVDLGAFLFTATKQINGQSIQLSGSVMGAPSLDTALQESVALAASLEAGFQQATITQAGQKVGMLRAPWGANAPIQTSQSVELTRWEGTPIALQHHLDTHVQSGVIGSLQAVAGSAKSTSPLRLAYALAKPSFFWRLTRR